MIAAAPVDWEVDLVYLDADHVLSPEEPNHVIVYIDTGDKRYYVETTSPEAMLPYPDGVNGWFVRVK
jgi:hypothetical protein